ncbi:uncharacterized protein LOC101734936 isoform X3 [Xenopus tropicalis]|uniref:Uncharacterized protein LOC101734936 isoform X3 n=1 Tax=Xenopus tropicalis TaxID=8364 RepID=A0A8J0SYD1_XENTR|nr:uncharacterized protein LOC101734936 isoform X3 [Xenopus tropicalis]
MKAIILCALLAAVMIQGAKCLAIAKISDDGSGMVEPWTPNGNIEELTSGDSDKSNTVIDKESLLRDALLLGLLQGQAPRAPSDSPVELTSGDSDGSNTVNDKEAILRTALLLSLLQAHAPAAPSDSPVELTSGDSDGSNTADKEAILRTALLLSLLQAHGEDLKKLNDGQN